VAVDPDCCLSWSSAEERSSVADAVRATVKAEPVEVVTAGRGVVVALHGDHDLTTVESLKQAVDEAVAAGARGVVVDLADAELICSVTLAALLWCRERVRRAGGRFVLSGPLDGRCKAMVISGLDRVFEHAPVREQAVELALVDDAASAAGRGRFWRLTVGPAVQLVADDVDD